MLKKALVMRWLPIALAVLGWHSLPRRAGRRRARAAGAALAGLAARLRAAATGAAILLRGPDLGTRAGRRLRLWAYLATLAPVIATALRVPQGLPTRPVWLALFGAPLAVSPWRGLRGEAVTPSAVAAAPPPLALKLHRWSAAVIVSFAALHFASHLMAAFSLALNTRVMDAVRPVYKQPPVEALLLLALPVEIGTGLWLFRAARDRALDRWDRLQLASGLYLAVFLAAHAMATAILFRDINFRAASGGCPSLFGDPSFLAYYVLGPLAVFAVACGARSLILRRLGPVRAERLAAGVLGLGAAVTLVISLALCGIHLRNDRDKSQPRPAKVGWPEVCYRPRATSTGRGASAPRTSSGRR